MTTQSEQTADAEVAPGLSCPRCTGDRVSALPANGLSRRPGFRCLECGMQMRGSTSIYVVGAVIGLGLTLVSSGFVRIFGDERDGMLQGVVSPFFIPLFLIALAYSVRRLLRPVPLRKVQ